jgi:hypothetical protein
MGCIVRLTTLSRIAGANGVILTNLDLLALELDLSPARPASNPSASAEGCPVVSRRFRQEPARGRHRLSTRRAPFRARLRIAVNRLRIVTKHMAVRGTFGLSLRSTPKPNGHETDH